MSCSTYILYIYYTYYNIYILYYTYYILYTILYNTIHTTYYNIWYIYIYHQPFAFPDLRLWKAQHLRQRRQLVLRVPLVARTAQRRPRHREGTEEIVGKPWGKLGKLGNTMESAPKVWKCLKTHQFLLSDNSEVMIFTLVYGNSWTLEMARPKWSLFLHHIHLDCSQVATANQAKGQKKGWSPEIFTEISTGRWKVATISSRYPWFSIHCSATKPRKMKLIKEDCSLGVAISSHFNREDDARPSNVRGHPIFIPQILEQLPTTRH